MAKGVVILTVIGGFEAVLQGEGAGVIGQAAKGGGGEDCARSGGWGGFRGAGHLLLKTGGLNSPHAQQTPAGGGHGLDQGCFGGVARLELAHESRGEGVEAAHGFTLENHGAGNEAV
jgi:hypothetical protein